MRWFVECENRQIRWKTDQQPPFVRGGSILAEGLMLMTDDNTKLYLIEPSPAGFKPLASAVMVKGFGCRTSCRSSR